MPDENDSGFPQIDTEDLELSLSVSQLRKFRKNRLGFVQLLKRLIVELGLQGQIEHLKVCSPAHCRAELYRGPDSPWPSKRVWLDIYIDQYMDEQLLRHEFQHEADRRNPEMLYDPALDSRWKKNRWPLDVAANISVDARLGERGLGKERRREEFRQSVGGQHEAVFEEVWANPPRTWPEIEDLANKLVELGREDRRRQRPVTVRPRCHIRVTHDEE